MIVTWTFRPGYLVWVYNPDDDSYSQTITPPLTFPAGDHNPVTWWVEPDYSSGSAHGDYGVIIFYADGSGAPYTAPPSWPGTDIYTTYSIEPLSQRAYVTYTSASPVQWVMQEGDSATSTFVEGPPGTLVTTTITLDPAVTGPYLGLYANLFIDDLSDPDISVQVHEWWIEMEVDVPDEEVPPPPAQVFEFARARFTRPR